MNFIRKDIEKLQKLRPIQSLIAIVFEWCIIVLSILLYTMYPFWWIAMLTIPLVGTRMYALYSLLHDGIHLLLYPNKKINDAITRIFLSSPLFYSLTSIRSIHYKHHAHLKDDEDPEMNQLEYPEFAFPFTLQTLTVILLKDLSGYNFIKYKLLKIVTMIKKRNISFHFIRITLFLALIIFLAYKFSILHLFILFWIVPYITVYQVLNRFRLYFEHNNLDESESQTRNMVFPLGVNFFISPYNLGYHKEHHAHPNIPFYNLPALNKIHNKKSKPLRIGDLLKKLYGKESLHI